MKERYYSAITACCVQSEAYRLSQLPVLEIRV